MKRHYIRQDIRRVAQQVGSRQLALQRARQSYKDDDSTNIVVIVGGGLGLLVMAVGCWYHKKVKAAYRPLEPPEDTFLDDEDQIAEMAGMDGNLREVGAVR